MTESTPSINNIVITQFTNSVPSSPNVLGSAIEVKKKLTRERTYSFRECIKKLRIR
ncbi:hypothetical protein QJS10_CPB15g01720 [Acorus calamus]|uniref:Uncharacterized protein n=1 Tax=Acorus calamus TaxID=4465 RepID=A0AAV9DBQ3_ACOCL|nr:hypothetical protein QJS10_CPB15g01720 [Acorus calamus]